MTNSIQEITNRHRLIACQGSAQLISAIATLRHLDTNSSTGPFRNHLLIHDLACPDAQAAEFANAIRRLAEVIQLWDSITYVDPERIDREVAAIPNCEQLILGQNNTRLSASLRGKFPQARKICYGDGIGLNFSNRYYDPFHFNNRQAVSQQPRQNFQRTLRHWMRQLRRKWKKTENTPFQPGFDSLAETEADFDLHCLMLCNRFDQRLESVEEIEPKIYVELFAEFGNHFESVAPAAHAQLSALADQGRQLVVLLTSNFSETQRMSLEAEIAGYLQLLTAFPTGSDVQLLIKPHPRDSYAKLNQLRQATDQRYMQTTVLNDPRSFYLPFESVYARYLEPRWNKLNSLHVATVSSACISLEYLYGQRCVQGFGNDLVQSDFAPLWTPLREKHEHDLRIAVDRIRLESSAARKVA